MDAARRARGGRAAEVEERARCQEEEVDRDRRQLQTWRQLRQPANAEVGGLSDARPTGAGSGTALTLWLP